MFYHLKLSSVKYNRPPTARYCTDTLSFPPVT